MSVAKRVRKHLKRTFIPHEENDFRPHFFRETGVLVLALIALLSFGFSTFHAFILLKNSDFIAAIFPGVLVDLTNESRIGLAASPLTPNPILAEAAQLKANHMAEHSYFAHTSPDGVTPWHWFIEAGYRFTHAGENLAVNFVDSEDVVEAWLESPGHRANILNGDFTEIGIATAEGTYKGRPATFVVQLFGRPLPASAAPVPVVAVSTEDLAPTPEVASVEIEGLEVVEESETFVAVEVSTGLPAEVVNEDVASNEAEGLYAPQSSFIERVLSQPRTMLQWFYAALAVVIALALTVTTLIEIERHHPQHAMYAVGLLILLFALFYINQHILPEVFVV